jgi:sulfoxide reductase heme-binding subunit YedZ
VQTLKPAVFVLCLLPLAYWIYQVVALTLGYTHQLGADPGKAIVKFNGEWTLRFLLLTLCVTPLRQMFAWNRLAQLRRMLGLFCFSYASIHLMSYMTFLLEFRFNDIAADIVKRPFITVGFIAFMALLPLAITSNSWMVRRLQRRWKTLHKLVYVILILALIHLLWLTRSDYTEAAVYAAVGLLLLGHRIKHWIQTREVKQSQN